MVRASQTIPAHKSQGRLKNESGPETLRQQCPGLTRSLDCSKEGLAMHATQFTPTRPNNQVGGDQ